MQKWIGWFILVVLLSSATTASAQGQIALRSVSVQLWPEFDQPNMLVIYDMEFQENTPLPFDFTLRVPLDSNVIAVAYNQDGNLLNAPYQEPYTDGNWQVLTLKVDTNNTYHIEYYTPLSRTDQMRTYTYLWPGDYPVGEFRLRLKVPIDTTEITTNPTMTEASPDGEDTYLEWAANTIELGQSVPMKISYTKSTDRLGTSGATLQASNIDDNTPGRVSLINYLPYILGGLGVFLILAGGIYFWKSGQRQSRPRKRRRAPDQPDGNEEIYCHQCGIRAQPGDRFCRTCGTRLRRES